MARGRSCYQQGRVVSTAACGWEIHYNIYLTDPQTGKAKRRHRSRVVGYRPKMRRAEAGAILAAELAAINGGPITRPTDGTITFGDWPNCLPVYHSTGRAGLSSPQFPGSQSIGPRPGHLSDCLFLRAAPQRALWSDLGMLPGECLHDRDHCMEWPPATQEDQAQKSFWRHQLSPDRDSRGGAMGDRAVADGISHPPSRCPDVSGNAGERATRHWHSRASRHLAALTTYPIAKKLAVPFHPTFQVLRRSFSTHGTKEAHPTEMQAQLGHSDPRMTLNTYTRTLGPEVIQMVNQGTNRILGLAEKGEEAVQ
jgi:hypothetical protein